MKKHLIVFYSFFLFGLTYGQSKFSNIEIYMEDKFPYKDYYSCPRLGMAYVNCDSYNCDGMGLEIAFTNCAPDADISEKESTIAAIDTEVDLLIATASCNKNKGFYLLLGEGIFIQPSDKLEIYSKRYYKKAAKINLTRFVEKFGKKLSEAFPNNKIYVIEWGW